MPISAQLPCIWGVLGSRFSFLGGFLAFGFWLFLGRAWAGQSVAGAPGSELSTTFSWFSSGSQIPMDLAGTMCMFACARLNQAH